jgi:hypothetical protein
MESFPTLAPPSAAEDDIPASQASQHSGFSAISRDGYGSAVSAAPDDIPNEFFPDTQTDTLLESPDDGFGLENLEDERDETNADLGEAESIVDSDEEDLESLGMMLGNALGADKLDAPSSLSKSDSAPAMTVGEVTSQLPIGGMRRLQLWLRWRQVATSTHMYMSMYDACVPTQPALCIV